MVESQAIIRHLYTEREVKKAVKRRRPRRRRFLPPPGRRLNAWIAVLTIVGVILAWSTVHVYYYNRLVDMRYDVDEAWAQVETQLQRRSHIQRNLVTITKTYARHERGVLTDLTKIRTAEARREAAAQAALTPRLPSGDGPLVVEQTPSPELQPSEPAPAAPEAPAPPIASGAQEALEQGMRPMIALNAEQYPQLMLSGNLQQFSEAIIDTETEIARLTSSYNEVVNRYSTEINQFPGSVFAWACGFENVEFYSPERTTLGFRQVEY